MDKDKYINVKIKKMVIFERKKGSKYVGNITANGKRKSFYGVTKHDVRNKAKKWLEENFDTNVKNSSVTLNAYMEYWLKTYKLNKIEQPSYERLESIYLHQIKNTIGHITLSNLTTEIIQKLIDGYACPDSADQLALAMSGLKKLKEQLNACLRTAVLEGLIDENPCSLVVLPNQYCIATPTKKQFALSNQEIEDFKAACLSKYKVKKEYRSRDGLVLLLVLSLGLRGGEALALEWDDFDIENMYVRIGKTIQYSKKTGTVVKDGTKTPAGTRIIPINENIKFYLKELKEYDSRNKIESKYVCCTSVGTRQSARNLQRSLDRISGWTKIENHITLHTLRHTFGSSLLRSGTQIEVVSKLMGHTSVKLTYDKYIHVLQEQQAMTMVLNPIV